jgi:hypothetical protein
MGMNACSCIIGKTVEEYAIGPFSDPSPAQSNDYLADLWTGGQGAQQSVRDIAEWLNKEILRAIYRDHARDISTNRIDHEYDILTGDNDVAKATLRDDLANDGIEIADIHEAMISSSSLYRHLTDCLDVEKETSSDGSTTVALIDRVQFTTSTLQQQVAEALTHLDEDSVISDGADAGVEVDITVTCPECGMAVGLRTAIEQGYICGEHSRAPAEGSEIADRLIDNFD